MKKTWIYYGVFFNEKVKELLVKKAKALVNIPDDWNIYADHMTIIYNDGDSSKEEKAAALDLILGEHQPLMITSIGATNEAVAFGVSNYATQNEHAHITIATAPGIKPVRSNSIKKWMPINTFYVTGTLKKVK